MQNEGLRSHLPGSDQQTVNAAMLMATRANPMMATLFMFVSFSLGIFSFIVKPILRKNLGERTFGILTILLCFLFLRAFYIYDLYGRIPEDFSKYIPGWYFRTDLAGIAQDNRTILPKEGFTGILGQHYAPKFPSPVGLYGYIILAFGAAEFINIWNRRRKKLRMHTQYRGESRLLGFLRDKKFSGVVITDTLIRSFLEPLLVLVLGLILYTFGDYYFGTALLFGGGALILEEYLFYIKRRQMLLDIIDYEIDGEILMNVKDEYQKSHESFQSQDFRLKTTFLTKATMD